MLKNYFKIAWRYLIRNKAYTTINILGLALGISVCLIIYLISGYELSYDRFHPDKERIYRMVSNYVYPGDGDIVNPNNISHAASHILRNEYPGIEQLADFYTYDATVTVPGKAKNTSRSVIAIEQGPYRRHMIITEPQYFSIFRYEWLAGNPAASLSQPFQVVLTESRARRYFGFMPLDQILGKELIYDDSLHLMVSGIVKDWDKKSDLIFKDFISFSTIKVSFLKNAGGFDDPNQPDSWGERSFAQTYIKLKKGVSPASANAWIAAMIKSSKPANLQRGEKFRVDLQPLSTLHFDTKYLYDYYSRQAHLPLIYALMGIGAFILVIAMINFINLSTALSIRRAKEIGIRKVLGSYRAGIVLQFLSETSIVVLFAVALSFSFTRPVLQGFQAFLPPGLGAGELIRSHTLVFLTIVTMLTTLLAGLYPAFVLSSFAPALSLKGQATGVSPQKQYLRKSLIVFQFAISLFFIIATIVVGGQIHFMLNKDLGFTKDAIVNVYADGINQNLHYTTADKEIFEDKVRKLAAVRGVSFSSRPVALDWGPDSWFIDLENGNKQTMSSRFADENYIPLYGLKIIAGRNLRILENDTLSEFLLNETGAREMGFKRPENAIGRRVSSLNTSGTVVGVLSDFYSQSLQKPISPLFIAGFNKDLYSRIGGVVSVKLASAGEQRGHFRTTLANIEKAWKEVYPTENFGFSFTNEDIARFYDEEQKNSKILNTAMAIAIFISCMGLFGLATFTAEQRTREIGIRKVLGASVSGIAAMLSKEFIRLVSLSILIASPIAWYVMHRWLQNYAYRMNISGWVFLIAGAATILIALITVSFQAVKASLANPVKSLRTE